MRAHRPCLSTHPEPNSSPEHTSSAFIRNPRGNFIRDYKEAKT